MKTELKARGVYGVTVSIHLSSMATLQPMPRELIARLADLIAKAPQGEYVSLDHIWDEDLEAGEYVGSVGVIRMTGPVVEVTTPMASWMPRDGVWLREAAEKKIRRYGAAQLKTLVLVIDGLGFIDQQQINSFREKDVPALPFAEIWIHSSFHGLQQLK